MYTRNPHYRHLFGPGQWAERGCRRPGRGVRGTASGADARLACLARLQQQYHPDCAVCGSGSASGMGLGFRLMDGGVVEAPFRCCTRFQGYRDWLHGGAISAVLDGAMTNCLFAAGIVAVTGELRVRFRQPLRIGTEATVRAWITRSLGPLHVLGAEVLQQGRVAASATGKFMEQSPALRLAAALDSEHTGGMTP